MEIFIVNLSKAVDKREYMREQLDRLKISNYRFVEAIYGKNLPESFFIDGVDNYPKCSLTKSEIGCALSHLKIYQEMVDASLPYAIILEDDVVLPDDFKEFSEKISESIDHSSSKVISLGKANKITLLRKYFSYNSYGEYTAVTGFGTYAYVINLAAAKSLLQHLMPIRYEADMFMHFRENGWLKYFRVFYPQYVHVIDDHDAQSDIFIERDQLKQKRHQYKKYVLLKKRSIWLRLKNRMRRIFWKIKQIRN
ncbi:MAG TPA: glycosyltransferase family 25 protein [Candidatus Ignatzschineria merdigallinarum]|uniref:Glycosyltransferase family 25 protein n=1 Tax=Candidatus Ignatzschineria merdigallinarum TaxID=2838621 RepID=A0A9D1TUS8_9GAMM|nr:glycosyltransferase family 25 protein [Candidatus Ignatzschineria merdigallinarum]